MVSPRPVPSPAQEVQAVSHRVITDGKPTIRRMALGLVERVDQSSLKRFLTLYGWDEEGVNRRRLESNQTNGAERRQAIKNLIQNPIH